MVDGNGYTASEAGSPRKKLGTIVVNSDVLGTLRGCVLPSEMQCCPPRDRYESQAPHLLDTLPLLAEAGFEVVIPEIVSLQTGGITHNGTNMNRLFSPLLHGRRNIERTMEPATAFLLQVARGHFGPHIRIVPPAADDHTPAADYVRESHRGEAMKAHGFKGAAKGIAIGLASQDRAGFNKSATVEWIKRMPLQQEPIALLTNEKDLVLRAAEAINPAQPRININLQGFIKAMHSNGGLDLIGVRPGIALEEVMDFVVKAHQGTRGSKSSSGLHPSYFIDRGQAATNAPKEPGAFSHHIAGIKDIISQIDSEKSAALTAQKRAALEAAATDVAPNGKPPPPISAAQLEKVDDAQKEARERRLARFSHHSLAERTPGGRGAA